MTSLAQQLQRLALPQSSFGNFTDKSRPSLLFETKQAATFDKEFFYAIGLNGFQELCGFEPTFHSLYFDSLFSEVAADTERTVKTKQFNKQLDSTIQSFLLQLSPYFLLKPAQKCIEWLVYRFRIHTFNIESLMKCIFPYYGTNLFVRAVQLTDKKNSNWSWVSEAQADGSPLSMRTLIAYCMKNLAFLEFLCDSLLQAYKVHPKKQGGSWQIRGMLNLFTSTVLGIVHTMDKIPETFLLHLMPVVLKGLKSGSADFQASSLMIISQLSVKVTFDVSALTSIVNLTTKYCLPQLHKEAIRTIALLCRVQENLNKFTKRSFRRLSGMENFISQVVTLSSSATTHRFLTIYFDALVPRAFVAADMLSSCDSDAGNNSWVDYSTIFKSLIEGTDLSKALQTHVFKLLILNYKDHSGSMSDTVKEVAHRMQQKYSSTFDEVVCACVEKRTVSAKVLKSFLNISLASAKHQLLPDTSMTLSIALLHPEATIRTQGIESLMEELSSSKCLLETKQFAFQNILQILEFDSNEAVVLSALQIVDAHFGIFNESNIVLGERLVKMCAKMWDEPTWDSVVQLCVKCLTSHYFIVRNANDETLASEKELRNKISVIVLTLFVQSVGSGKSFKRRNLVRYVVGSRFAAAVPLLNALGSLVARSEVKGGAIENFMKNFAHVVEKEGLQETIFTLLDTMTSMKADPYFNRMLVFLCSVAIRIANFDVLSITASSMSLVDYLIQATETSILLMRRQDADDEVEEVESSIPVLVFGVFCNGGGYQQLSDSLLLHVWLGVVPRLAKFSSVRESIMQQSKKAVATKSPFATLKNVFKLFLDLTLVVPSWRKNLSDMTDLLLANFLDKPFDSPADVLLFLSDIWLDFLCLEWQDLDSTSKHSIYAFKIALALVKSLTTTTSKPTTKLSDMLSTSSFIVPSVLLACTSSNAEIRLAATEVLAPLSVVPNCPAASMIKFLSSHFEEIVLDEFHCTQAIGQYFNVENSATKLPAKVKKQRNALLKDYVTNHVASLAASDQSHTRVKYYEECLGQVINSIEHQVLIPRVSQLLDESESSVSDDKCLLISVFFGKLEKSVSHDDACENLYLKALNSNPNHFNSLEDNKLVPRLVALDLLRGKLFAAFSDVTKSEIVRLLIEIKSTSTRDDISTAASKSFKSLTIHSRHVTKLIKKWLAPSTTSQQGNAKRVKVDETTIMEKKDEQSKAWKEFVVALELLHHKKRIQKPQDLIGPLFDVLMRVIDQKIRTDNADYVTLLLLGCLLNMFERSDRLSKDIINDIQANMKVELLVKCIRSTGNTQTHHHALMLLAKSTHYCPEKVLHSVMSIFTFMGNTLLRRDDSYSFQVITKTIQTVIPPLLQLKEQGSGSKEKDSVLGVLRVFVDTLPHIPTHRRLIVFEELLTTMGADNYLWQAIVLLIDQHVCQLSKAMSEENEKEESRNENSLSKNLESSLLLWTSICQLFGLNTQIEAVLALLSFLQTYVHKSEKSSKFKSSFLLDSSKRSTNQIRRFRIIMLTLSSQIVKHIKSASNEDDRSVITAHAQRLFQQGLHYLELVINTSPDEDENAVDDVALRYQKALVRRVNDLLEKVNSLLPLRDFLCVLDNLLMEGSTTQSFVMKQKAIQLFHSRISSTSFTINDDEEKLLLDLSGRFVQMLTKGCESVNKNENLLHTAALGLTQIVRISCKNKPSSFVSIQPIICEIVNNQQLSDNVLSSLLICLGEVTLSLKAHSIVNLAKISPCLIEQLSSKQALNVDSVLTSLLTTITKLFSCLAHFLSPYIDGFLAKLSVLSYLKRTSKKASATAKTKTSFNAKRPKKDSNPSSSISQLVSNVLAMIANNLSSRVVIPAFRRAYDKIVEELPLAASCLLPVMRQHVGKLNKAELTQEATNLMTFLLHCMDFRLVNNKMSSSDVSVVEKEVLEGVILLLIKLPESAFRPLYIKLHDWGCSHSSPPARVTVFYKCTALMAAKLKGLFEIFAVDLLGNITQELKAEVPNESERHQVDHVRRLSYVIDTLQLMLTHSSPAFINQERFEEIIHPLVNQLEISIPDQRVVDDYITNHVVSCVGQLAATARDNVTWQPLNYHILMKTRHSCPQVRCQALNCLKAAVDKLGDDYLLLLPETIPFLAELLEDESDVVEQCCQQTIKEMEEKLGEPLQKYF